MKEVDADNEEEMNLDDEKKSEEKKEEGEYIIDDEITPEFAPDVTFGRIELEEKNKVDEDQKKLLSSKRKRAKKTKRIPLQLFKPKNRKPEPSYYQKLFNLVSKSDIINPESVTGAAQKLSYEINKDNVDFFVELGKAKASLKKYGLPGNICKHHFHIFTYLDFYKETNIITDDDVIWNCYYSQVFQNKGKNNLSKYSFLLRNSEILDFSLVSDKVASFKSIYTGYVQDYFSQFSVIRDKPATKEEVDTVKKVINNEIKDAIMVRCKFPNNKEYVFYQYKTLIMAITGEVNTNKLADYTTTIKCINSKNKLSLGLKQLKINDQIGTYINIHDMKLTDFSPACIFTDPAIPNIRMFVNVKVDANAIFNEISDKLTTYTDIQLFPLPPNFVFWDNISSFVQLIGLIKLVSNPGKTLDGQITTLIDIYYKNKDIFSIWKRIYKTFEFIALNFYDKITSKLTIDGITSLEPKVTLFLTNYVYLKNNVETYNLLKQFIASIPNTTMMRNFVMTNAPHDLVTSIARLIIILKSGKKDIKEINLEDMFRSIGILCTEVLYGGDFAMIPKIRSMASFLGGAQGQMTNETFKKNIAFLVDAFKKDLKKKEETSAKKMFLGYKDMDMLIEKLITNSSDKLNDDFIKKNIEKIKEKIRSDKTLYDSLRDDVQQMLLNEDDMETVKLYGDFLENDLFITFLKTYKDLNAILYNGVTNYDDDRILGALKVSPKIKRKVLKLRKINPREKVTADLDSAPVTKMFIIDKQKLINSITGNIRENVQEDQLKNALAAVYNSVAVA